MALNISKETHLILKELGQLPSNQLYEEILTSLHSIQRELVIMDNRLSKIEDILKNTDEISTNRHLRLYGMKRENPIHFKPTHS